MVQAFKLQDPGEGIHEVEVREILVSAGDRVTEGQEVLVVESDKAAVEVPSPYSGTVEEIRVSEGGTAKVGDVLMTFALEGEEAGEAGPEDADEQAEQPAPEEGADEDEADAPREQGEQEEGESREEPAEAEDRREAAPDRPRKADQGPIKAAPAARKLAREKGIELADVEPSGAHGQVLKEDVMRAVEGRGTERRERPREGDRTKEQREPLRSIRRTTAQHMAKAWAEIPHVSHHDEVDITRLEQLRRKLAPEVEAAGGKLTLTAFALKAIAAALQEHPRFNASLDAEAGEIILKQHYDINLALDSERGLLTPVVRAVDRKSVFALAVEVAELAARVRDGNASKDDLAQGTFTLTNVGALGGTAFNPIINHPQVAIVGMAQARYRPVVVGNSADGPIEPRFILPLILAFDHRVVDGADAARFTARIAEMLADPDTFLLRAH